MRTAARPNLEDVLATWIQRASSNNLPVNGAVACAKAEEIGMQLQLAKSLPKAPWADFSGHQAASVQEAAYKDWQATRMKALLEECIPCNVSNVDQTALFYKLLPVKTLDFVAQRCTDSRC